MAAPAQQILASIDAQAHLVLYGVDEQAVERNVSRNVLEGLRRGEGLLVVATARHQSAFTGRLRLLGADTETAAPQVFRLFKRWRGNEIPRTGSGLAICKKIVEGPSGKIWAEPAPQRGSAFCFTIREVED